MAAYEVPDNDPQDNIEVDLSPKGKEGEPEIEIVDDTPEEDRNRPARKPGTESAVPNEDEIGQYTKGVQDRLRKMTWEFHEERRAKESALRENEKAIGFAKSLLEQNKRLQELIQKGHDTMKQSSKNSAESEIAVIRAALTQAITAGDNEKVADLQEKLGRATARAEAINHIPPIQMPEPEIPQELERPQQQPRVQLSDTNQKWVEANPWFGTDQRMTAIAMATHDRLLREGVPPESKYYYAEIDREVREMFPDKFEDTKGKESHQPSRRSNVAPTSRAAPGGKPGKVTLTLSEQKVADKLGVPYREYAAAKLQRQMQEQG